MKITLLFVILGCLSASAQQDRLNPDHSRFFFSTAMGGSAVLIADPFQDQYLSGSLSFPNFKFGYSLTDRLLAGIYLPGSIYKYNGPGRSRDRGFEGIMPFVQYWPCKNWWISGGAGLLFDAPAFYDVKDENEADFYLGPGLIAGTGYEIWKKGKFVLDVQARFHGGYSVLPEGHRNGFTSTLLIGFNWY